MIKCKVRLITDTGFLAVFTGSYPTTADAVIEAIDNYGICSVSVIAIKE